MCHFKSFYCIAKKGEGKKKFFFPAEKYLHFSIIYFTRVLTYLQMSIWHNGSLCSWGRFALKNRDRMPLFSLNVSFTLFQINHNLLNAIILFFLMKLFSHEKLKYTIVCSISSITVFANIKKKNFFMNTNFENNKIKILKIIK